MVSAVIDQRHDVAMSNLDLERTSVDYALLLARRRADKRVPFSPSWDAAMGLVEDLKSEAFRLDEIIQSATRGHAR